jgi:hypothetical protein
MITSLADSSTYLTSYPNATLVPDWDLLEEIHQQYCLIPHITHRYQWVRGHQDSNTPGNPGSLPIEARLNILADSLATEYHTMVDSQPRPQTPLMSSTKCILQVSGHSIHAHYPASLRRSENHFPRDLESFLQSSSLLQLQKYITQYSPVILASHARFQAANQPHTCPMRGVTSNTYYKQRIVWNNCEAILESDAKSPSKLVLKH